MIDSDDDGFEDYFEGLNEDDLENLAIYDDYEPDEDFISELNKCKDPFLNVLCDEDALRNSTMNMDDEIREVVFDRDTTNSDDEVGEENRPKYRIHDPCTKWNKMKPMLGDVFESPAQLKYCVINYAVANGYGLYFEKCDSKRVVVRCGTRNSVNTCPYRLYASWMYNERSFQVKSICENHECKRNFQFGNLVGPTWIAKHYIVQIMNKPNVKLKDIQHDMKQWFKLNVSMNQCQRARQWAKQIIEGKLSEHYAKVWDYAHEILTSNPGSTCKVGVTVNPDGKNYFHRFYVCFKAVRDGWNRGCRKVIGLDGCFLKGEVKGELLTAIGRDANNQVFPIAWAVVDVENKGNWTWFLELLHDDIDAEYGRGMTVISDQHKGLLQAVNTIFPHVEHRQCARHIYANFRKSYSGLEYKKLFWAASMSSHRGEFERHMNSIKKISADAYDYLMSKEPHTWCRAFFPTGTACEAVENGISECFNAIILEARKKPLLTMLEEIRIYVMERFSHMSEKCSKWKGNICPAIIKKMKKFGKHMRYWIVINCMGMIFETRGACGSYRVDLDKGTCSCRLWNLSGIPCVHALAAINYVNLEPEDFISNWFSKEKFLASYETNILPVNGSIMWATSNCIKPLPPMIRRMPGRPQTKRRRHASENESKYPNSKVSVQRTVKCSKCLEFGHNKKGCKNEERVVRPTPPKKAGRPRKSEGEAGTSKAGESRKSEGEAGTSKAGKSRKSEAGTSDARRKKSIRRGGFTGTSSRINVQGGPADGQEDGVNDGQQGGPADGQDDGVNDGQQGGPADGQEDGLNDGQQGGPADGQEGGPEGGQESGPEGQESGLTEGQEDVFDVEILLAAGYTMDEIMVAKGSKQEMDFNDYEGEEYESDNGSDGEEFEEKGLLENVDEMDLDDGNEEEGQLENVEKVVGMNAEGFKHLDQSGRRKPSERIIKQKLGKVTTKDGVGSSSGKPVDLV